MIPKKIYYCWFGKNKKSKLLKQCLKSWERYCPDYDVIEINESNFNIEDNYYCKKAYKEKKWAYVSDYARLKVLYDNGGIYLDTDMELIKNIDSLLKYQIFLGFESKIHVNGAIIGGEKNNIFIKKCLDFYQKQKTYINIPWLITDELQKLGLRGSKTQNIVGIQIFESQYFYPYKYNTKFNKKCITEKTFSIHWREGTWIPLYKKILGKIGFFKFIKKYLNK